MPNTNVFTGMDGSITVAVDDAESPEGQAANAVSDAFALSPIGRASDVSVQVTSELRPFHEVGQRYATELRPGNVNVSGTIGPRPHQRGAAPADARATARPGPARPAPSSARASTSACSWRTPPSRAPARP